MLDYLYCEDYDDSSELARYDYGVSQTTAYVNGHDDTTIPTWNTKLRKTYLNAMMYVTANKYTIRGLEDLAERKLVSNLTHEWKGSDFIHLIKYIFGSNTPANPKLQGVVATFATRHIPTLKEFQPFHDILKEFPHFAYIFSNLMMERMVQLDKKLW
jgi:hypothetical protein